MNIFDNNITILNSKKTDNRNCIMNIIYKINMYIYVINNNIELLWNNAFNFTYYAEGNLPSIMSIILFWLYHLINIRWKNKIKMPLKYNNILCSTVFIKDVSSQLLGNPSIWQHNNGRHRLTDWFWQSRFRHRPFRPNRVFFESKSISLLLSWMKNAWYHNYCNWISPFCSKIIASIIHNMHICCLIFLSYVFT